MRRSIVLAALVAGLSLSTAPAVFAGGVTHRVSAGSPDICAAFGARPGCDANFSLVATQYADGRVTGEFVDVFGKGFGYTRAVIDCLSVVGNEAWVSGVIISGHADGHDLTGLPISTRVVDNGTSTNDPPDQAGFSRRGDQAYPCTAQPDDDLFDLLQGQVSVK
jgi:hypothetical protein